MIGDVLEADRLILAGADVDAVDAENRSPLSWAAIQDQVALGRQLIANGATVNHRDLEGKTAVYWSTERNHIACLRMLLAAGANPRIRNHAGTMPVALTDGDMKLALLIAGG
ncbi:MAG: ankyrin repeat domain-containing protein [Chloroflexota bacterium]|nr:ankyrin repeat domain-containing protein [Chloroflexota bacterium]